MANTPSKRRGITLGARTNVTPALDQLMSQPEAPAADDTAANTAVKTDVMTEQVAELRRMKDDLDASWRRQTEALQRQLQDLERQRDEMGLQAGRLQASGQTPRTSGRVGVLLALLALTAVAALGFESWSRLEYMAHDLSRVGNDFSRLAPQVQAVRGEVVSLTSGMAQTNSAVGSLREDASGMRSDLGSTREAVERLPKEKTAVQTAASDKRGTPRTVPRNATTMTNPYRIMRPRMPW